MFYFFLSWNIAVSAATTCSANSQKSLYSETWNLPSLNWNSSSKTTVFFSTNILLENFSKFGFNSFVFRFTCYYITFRKMEGIFICFFRRAVSKAFCILTFGTLAVWFMFFLAAFKNKLKPSIFYRNYHHCWKFRLQHSNLRQNPYNNNTDGQKITAEALVSGG